MAQKIRDIAVKTGEYTDGQGMTKGRWQNVGALMKGDDGGEFIILHRWFNPAGVPNPQDRDSVVLSCFEIRDRNQQGGQPAEQPATNSQPRQSPESAPAGAAVDDEDSIPF